MSTVDEASLEETVNTYSREGWALDGVQFAMREASKRPSMAFVFMTKQVPVEVDTHDEETSTNRERDARRRLRRLAADSLSEDAPSTAPARPFAVAAIERLRQLAEDGDGDRGSAHGEPESLFEFEEGDGH